MPGNQFSFASRNKKQQQLADTADDKHIHIGTSLMKENSR